MAAVELEAVLLVEVVEIDDKKTPAVLLAAALQRWIQGDNDVVEVDVGRHQNHADNDGLRNLILPDVVLEFLLGVHLQSLLKGEAVPDALYQLQQQSLLRKVAAEVEREALLAQPVQQKRIEVPQQRVLRELDVGLDLFDCHFGYRAAVAEHVVLARE